MLRIRLASILTLTAGAVSLATACSGAPTTEESGEERTGDAAQHWETKGTTSEHSTHVWIVERAIDLLGTKSTGESAAIRAILNDATCNSMWRQGIDDADYLHQYNDGNWDLSHDSELPEIIASGATWKSHFYDPDTGLNYKGESSPTARTRANELLSAAVSHLQAGSESQGCYELGLTLHYMTDLTQPMHAANFTNLDVPIGLHQGYENHALAIQAFVGTAPPIFDLPIGSPDWVLVEVAHESKGYWPALRAALGSLNQASIDFQVRNNLWAAQVAAARYLHAVGHAFGAPGKAWVRRKPM